MYITINLLISDTLKFFKNQWVDIFIFSFVSAIVSLILYYLFVPLDEIAAIIKNVDIQNNFNSLLIWANQLSNADKETMLRFSILLLIIIFIGLVLLIASIITYLSELSVNNHINVLETFILSFHLLPKVLILLIICTVIIYCGLILFILPGIILAIGFSLSPIILITNKNIMLLQSIYQSWNIAVRYWLLILLILLIWLILQISLTILLRQFYFLPNIVNNIISFTLNNLLISFILIYLFRLYMLTQNNMLTKNNQTV